MCPSEGSIFRIFSRSGSSKGTAGLQPPKYFNCNLFLCKNNRIIALVTLPDKYRYVVLPDKYVAGLVVVTLPDKYVVLPEKYDAGLVTLPDKYVAGLVTLPD